MASKKKQSRRKLLRYFRKAAEIQGKASPEMIEQGRCYPDGQAYYSLLWYFDHEINLDLNKDDASRYSPLLDAYLGAEAPDILSPVRIRKKDRKRIDRLLRTGFPQSRYPLNDNQVEAVCKALCYPLSFIQGPPGTGKTEVILRIAALELARGGTVAVVSTNSTAVENVEVKALSALAGANGEQLDDIDSDLAYQAATKLVCLGSAGKRAKAAGPVHKEALFFESGQHEFVDGSAITGWEQNRRFDEFTEDYPFVTSTVHSLKKCFADGDVRKYDLLIVDEASQMSLTVGIVALSCARRAVFVGDVEQLPPVAPEGQLRALEKYERSHGLLVQRKNSPYNMAVKDISFLSSCYKIFVDKNSDLNTMLTEHYRCHPAIIGFSNEEIYGGKLVIHDVNDAKHVPFPISIRWYKGDYRESVWPPSAPREEQPDKKIRATCVNEKQIAIMREEELPRIARLARKGKSICVLSPFRGQIMRLQSLFTLYLSDIVSESEIAVESLDTDVDDKSLATGDHDSHDSALVSLTIHKSQGQEFDVVYLLPVEDGNWEWPWSQGRRLVNVAVTRAKCELHVILSAKLMSKQRQRELVGVVAQVKRPADEKNDPGRQELFVRKLVDYAAIRLAGLSQAEMELQERWSDPYRGSYGFHETNVVSVFDDIPYNQHPNRSDADSTPEFLVARALGAMEIEGVAVAEKTSFSELAFENGDLLSDRCGERYKSAADAHFDFVIFDEQTRRVLVAIEVDGPQHRFKREKGSSFPTDAQIVFDRKKDGVARDVCAATPALLAWDRRRKCIGRPSGATDESAAVETSDLAPEVEWVFYPSMVGPESSFVFLRIPSDGSTYCEFEALKAQARNLPLEKADGYGEEHALPPTVEEYVLRQWRICREQGGHPTALYVVRGGLPDREPERSGVPAYRN